MKNGISFNVNQNDSHYKVNQFCIIKFISKSMTPVQCKTINLNCQWFKFWINEFLKYIKLCFTGGSSLTGSITSLFVIKFYNILGKVSKG